MPKFLADEVKSKVDSIIGGLHQPVSAEAAQQASEHVGSKLDAFKNELAGSLVKKVLDQLNSMEDGEGKTNSGKPSKAGAKSWLEALAQAMGKTLGEKAGRMVELSETITRTTGGKGEKAAKENTEATLEMQGVGQMFSLMQNAFSAAIKSIGEGLSQAARKG